MVASQLLSMMLPVSARASSSRSRMSAAGIWRPRIVCISSRLLRSGKISRARLFKTPLKSCRTAQGTSRQVAYTRSTRDDEQAAEGYRAKARECEERAGQTRDSFIKQQLIEMAQKWHTMAAYGHKYGR